jgi:hypothetical protein
MNRDLDYSGREFDSEIDSLVHPSRVFERPSDVLNEADLSLNEKRAILASWASDACAIEAAPALRKSPSGRVVTFDEIMDALRSLDLEAAARRKTVACNPLAGDRRVGRSHQRGPIH